MEKKLTILSISLFVIFIIYGKIQIIYGSGISTMIIPKKSFSLSETFVNFDILSELPSIIARMKYPLTIIALQERGLLETDNQREKRIQEELLSDAEKVRIENEKWRNKFEFPEK